MMQKAKERGADRFELFSNAPMWWMCKNDNPSGGADPNKDNLRDDHFEAFAHYMAAVAAKSKLDWGVPFTTIDPFNEPLSSWWDENCKQEGCHFSVAAQRRLLPLLRRDLDRRGLRDLPIAASDETFVSQAIDAWKGYDDATRALVAQINVHGYQGDKSPRAQFRELIGERKLWMSEHGEGDGSGLELAKNLHLDFRHLKPTAWCYWQPLDGGGWGMLESDVPKAKMNSANPKYFVVAQYTRHIRPGMAILATSDVDSVAAWDPARKRLVVIVTNLEKTESSKTLDLSAFATLGPTARRWCTEPKAFARYRKLTDVPVQDKKLSVTLPPESVTTFEVSP
jgi:galactan endo-1,6-beta-galactosidase